MRLAKHYLRVGAAFFLAVSAHAQGAGGEGNIPVGGSCTWQNGCECLSGFCDNNICSECASGGDCSSHCCTTDLDSNICVRTAVGQPCFTLDSCDCDFGRCLPCAEPGCTGRVCLEVCNSGDECLSECCATQRGFPVCVDGRNIPDGDACFTDDECDCISGNCISGVCVACAPGTSMCDDPHMVGLRGQAIDWSGVDGGWYCLVTVDNANIHVNVRLTAPLPQEFPDRQLITALSVSSEGHSLVIEVENPYSVDTHGCPGGVSPCLANGGLRATVDGNQADGLLRSSRHEYVADGIAVSASNLPVECRQFGGDKSWARMYDEMLQGSRELSKEEQFEDWILRFDHMAAPAWCTQFIALHDLVDLQSNHAIFKIETSAVTVRLIVGTNVQGNGELDWDGRVLPDLEFWQMDVGLHGLSVESKSLSGILGETARPVLDKDGNAVMSGYDAFRGTVEDYRVSGSLGTDFAILHTK